MKQVLAIYKILLLNVFLLFSVDTWAAVVPIDLNDFFADPTVTVELDGSFALLAEDPGFSPVILSNDPGLGDPNIIFPGLGVSLSFDYDFSEAAGEDDEFGAFLIDAATGFSISGFELFFQNSGAGTIEFDLSSLVGLTLGLEFQLISLPNDSGFDSVARVSNVQLETQVSSVPLPSSLLLFFMGIMSLVMAKKNRTLV